MANTFYIGGLLALAATALCVHSRISSSEARINRGGPDVSLMSCRTLDIIVSFKWHHAWKLQRRLAIRSILLGGLRPNETAAEAQYILSGALARIDTELGQVVA